MQRKLLYGVFILLACSSCRVQKYLPQGERIYKGAIIKVEKEEGVKHSAHFIKKQLKLAVKPRANKFWLGKPYKVWWWYVIGEPKKKQGLRNYLRNILAEPPVLSGTVNPNVVAENMQAFLENLGYFHSTVKGDTINTDYFSQSIYTAKVFPRYKIRNINWVNDSSALVKLLKEKQQDGIVKTGDYYRLSDIEAERDRLDVYIKSQGYFYFSPDYILAYADSTVGNRSVDIYLSIKNNVPERALHPYTINRITVFPNYTLLLPPPDTSKAGTFEVDGLSLRDTVHSFKSSVFTKMITYRPGQLYSSRDQNTTLNRLINLGPFKFVKNRYEAARDSSDPYRLNVFYYLTPAKKHSLQAQLDGFSKESRYLGSQVSLNWKNKNLFKGAEQLAVKVYGGLELSFSDSVKTIINYRLGTEVSLTFPGYRVPFFKIKENHLYPPRTRLLFGYELFRKHLYYTTDIYRLKYEFDWKETSNKEHAFAPFTFTYIRSRNLTDTFLTKLSTRPALLANVYSEIIMGSFYSYTFNTANPFAKNQWYFKGSVDVGGNLAGLISGAKSPRQKTIFNTPFDQYVKLDADLRYQKKLRNNFDLVNRILIGVGLPYHNSNLLPFSKQYVIGGSGSLRGFTMRQIGPGSYRPSLDDQQYFQIIGGDFRLQMNSELRMPVFAKLSSAVFIDAGNIWTKDTILFGKAGQLKRDFYNEIAVGAGAGLRFDAGIVLVRFDIGVPLRKPYLPQGQRWVINQVDFGDSEWRRQNLIFGLALGYPF